MEKKILKLSPLKAIRTKCLDCSAGSTKEVRECQVKDCPLYIFRMGKNPHRAGIGGNISKNVLNEIYSNSRRDFD